MCFLFLWIQGTFSLFFIFLTTSSHIFGWHASRIILERVGTDFYIFTIPNRSLWYSVCISSSSSIFNITHFPMHPSVTPTVCCCTKNVFPKGGQSDDLLTGTSLLQHKITNQTMFNLFRATLYFKMLGRNQYGWKSFLIV